MNKHVVFLAAIAVLLLQIGSCIAMTSLAKPARTITVQARNGEQMTLSQTDLEALQSGFFKQIALPEEQGLPVEAITVLPIPSLRPLQLLLPGSQLAEAQYNDVAEATILADLLVIPNGVDLLLKRLGRENIKLLCQLYQDHNLEGREGIERYIHPFIPYERTQQLGVAATIRASGVAIYNAITATGHTDPIRSVALSPDGNTVVTGSKDRTAIVWQRGEDGQLHIIQRLGIIDVTDQGLLSYNTNPARGHVDWVTSVALSSDSNTVVTGSWDHTAIVWQRGEDGQLYIAQRLGEVSNRNLAIEGHIDRITSVALAPDGNTIITGSQDYTAIIWQRGENGLFHSAQRLGVIDVTDQGLYYNTDPDHGHTDVVTSVALSPDSNTIITGSNDHTVIIWQRGEDHLFHMAQRLGRIGKTNPDRGHTDMVRSVASSPDGNTIVTGSADRTAIIWQRDEDHLFHMAQRLGEIENIHLAHGHIGSVTSLALSPDSNTIITGSRDYTAIVWQRGEDGQFYIIQRLGRGQNLRYNTDPKRGHIDSVLSIALSPDGNTITTGSYDGTAIVWQKQSVDEFCTVQTANIHRHQPRVEDELRGFCSIQ